MIRPLRLLLLTLALAGSPPGHAAPRPDAGALPPPSVTGQSVALAGGTLRFTAIVEAIPLRDRQGQTAADVVTTAYLQGGADPALRPVTFAINGGPGYASAWLQLGALGPWRLPMSGTADAPSASPAVQPNAETWLDFTDLVFIDPPGTGYSRVEATGEAARRLWSVDGDTDAVAETIRAWLQQHGRLGSPKYFVGESYGGFRGPRVLRALEQDQGVGLSGLVLISPVLDFGGHSAAFDPFYWAARLPSMAAIARAAHGEVRRAAVADAERAAATDYLLDLTRGLADDAAVQRASVLVASLTGLDPALVRRYGGRLPPRVFLGEIDRAQGRIASPYDGTVTTANPFPSTVFDRVADPVLQGLAAPLGSAMTQLYAATLGWSPAAPYRLLNEEASRQWDFGDHDEESMTPLRVALALDPHLHVLVEQGLFDLVAPYFATQLLLDTIPLAAGGDRVRLAVHPGGHMLYTQDASRAALHDEARDLEQHR
jgi:carboxypeptidase C (cathepsin A)